MQIVATTESTLLLVNCGSSALSSGNRCTIPYVCYKYSMVSCILQSSLVLKVMILLWSICLRIQTSDTLTLTQVYVSSALYPVIAESLSNWKADLRNFF
jgi:hypothetical protein